MWRTRKRLKLVFLFLTAPLGGGCGGGETSVSPPPPPTPDFSLSFSAPSVSFAQGATSSSVNIVVAPTSGFADQVQVTLDPLPAGVSSNPASPFSVSASSTTPVVFGASASAATGDFTITAQGTAGTLKHTSNLTLKVQAGVVSAFSRSNFVATDTAHQEDYPFGDPIHHHIAYDPVGKHVFVPNRARNSVNVFAAVDQSRLTDISVPGASSADLSADGTSLWVGTALDQIAAIDVSSLTVKSHYTVSGVNPSAGTIYNRPVELFALSNGKLVLRLRQPSAAAALLTLWDPATNALTDLTPVAPAFFQLGLGPLARTGDHQKILAAAGDSSGKLLLLDAGGSLVSGPASVGAGATPRIAANPDGTRFAVALLPSGTPQVLLLDGSLSQVASYSSGTVNGLVFSRDGTALYISESSAAGSVITVLDGNTGQLKGQVPDLAIQGVPSEIEDVDSTQLLFALSNRGVGFLDASKPGALPLPAPSLSPPPSLQPATGGNAGGTPVTLTGQNFSSVTGFYFGAQTGNSVTQSGASQIAAISPASVISDAVPIRVAFTDGWFLFAPDAFSYGPQIQQILPNAGNPAGAEQIAIYGYGFGLDPAQISIKFGSAAGQVQKLENVSAIRSSLSIDTTYPFPLQRITVLTPALPPGLVDVSVTAPSGTISKLQSFQVLQSLTTFAKPGNFHFLAYDTGRQRIYLTDTDHLDVFDLLQKAFIAPLQVPGGPPPTADLRGLALTPDGATLLVANFGSQLVYLMDPLTGTGTWVSTGSIPGYINSGPTRVAATDSKSAFVGISGESGQSNPCAACLAEIDLSVSPPTIQTAPQPQVANLAGPPLVQSSGRGDRVFLSFGSAPGGPVARWLSSSPNQLFISNANASGFDIGTADDGNIFAVRSAGEAEFRSSDLSLVAVPEYSEILQVPGRNFVPGTVIHPSGALVYQPYLVGAAGSSGFRGGIDILDAHSGALRLRIFLPLPFMTDVDALHGSFLASDETGSRLFAITSTDGTPQNASLTVVQLSQLPLALGSVSPSSVLAAAGNQMTLRGSGFQPGTAVAIDGKIVSVTLKDASTLTFTLPIVSAGPHQISLKNPNGEAVSLDAAFTAN
jgi:hypothetical protein